MATDYGNIDWLESDNEKYRTLRSVALNVYFISAHLLVTLRSKDKFHYFDNRGLSSSCLVNIFSLLQTAKKLFAGCCKKGFLGPAFKQKNLACQERFICKNAQSTTEAATHF